MKNSTWKFTTILTILTFLQFSPAGASLYAEPVLPKAEGDPLREDATSLNRFLAGQQSQQDQKNFLNALNNSLMAPASRSVFTIFDGIGKIAGKPDLTASGLASIRILYVSTFWPAGMDRSQPDEATVRKVARSLSADVPVVIDIEHWKLQGDPAMVEKNIDKLIHVADWMHQENPKLKLGFYGILPIDNPYVQYGYLMALRHPEDQANLGRFTKAYQQMQADNKRLQRLADHVDFIAPSLYTFNNPVYGDYQKDWVPNAVATLQEAARYGKPVYAFVWFQFNESTLKGHTGDYTLIPGDFWQKELKTIQKYANGAIIWGSPTFYSGQWDSNAEWWKTTVNFIKTAAEKNQITAQHHHRHHRHHEATYHHHHDRNRSESATHRIHEGWHRHHRMHTSVAGHYHRKEATIASTQSKSCVVWQYRMMGCRYQFSSSAT